MSLKESIFATMRSDQFIKHLEKHSIVPEESELNSSPVYENVSMSESIAITILNTTGQRFGWPEGESSAK